MKTEKEIVEIWEKIEGYAGYETSNLGQIRSLDRNILTKDGFYRKMKGHILKCSTGPWGYLTVTLSQNDIQKTVKVHRVVIAAFLGNSKLEVNHKNLIKTDNRLENLEYITRRDNSVHYHKSRKRGLPTSVHQVESGRFISKISINGKLRHLGTFETVDEASKIYNNKLKEINS